ncbi:MAG TPA: ABC transporter ATP-binding protein [Thermodesulfovibrionales bacterium]|nr:ABC transporter ATP-binding protein [Thermodesulfovibrionales bacterium]
MSLLEVRDLSISFKTASSPVRVVNRISFAVEEAEVFGLVGESGCGKSITALGIIGLLPENAFAEGAIRFKGADLLTMNRESLRGLRGRDIAMIFQEPMTSLNPVLTIGYQIAEAITTHENRSRREAWERSVDLLRAVKIPSPDMRVKEYPHQMSGGMRQRAMIAMAIACNPSLLIADEPTTALDVTIQSQILDLLRRLRRERAMSLLLITHDLGIISENADRVAIMYAGRLMEVADVAGLFSNPRNPYTLGLLESLPRERGTPLTPIPGFVPRPDELPPGCKFSDRCRFVKDYCREKEPELEAIEPGHLTRCFRAREFR